MLLGALVPQDQHIEVGAMYRRDGAGSCVEIAQVLEVGADRMGIPHVRYQLNVYRGNGTPRIETRTLSLEAFFSHFQQRIEDSE